MVSDTQRVEMLEKLALILKEIKTSSSIQEISEKTSIPTSTIQRYLNREDLFKQLGAFHIIEDKDISKLIAETKKWLANAKKKGLRAGGKKSQDLYGYSKEEDGKFSGRGK